MENRKAYSLIINDEAPLFNMSDHTYTKRKIEEDEDLDNKERQKSSF